MNVMAFNWKLHTNKQQNRFKKRILHKEKRERLLSCSVFKEKSISLERNFMAPQGGSKAGDCCLSIAILNILYDRHDPYISFWCIMSFEHLNFKI